MKPSRLKPIWVEGKCALNRWLSIPNSFSDEIKAAQVYDSITIDMQLGVIDYQAVCGMLQATRSGDAIPFVCVPSLDPALVI